VFGKVDTFWTYQRARGKRNMNIENKDAKLFGKSSMLRIELSG
jgi:hypothetical protein